MHWKNFKINTNYFFRIFFFFYNFCTRRNSKRIYWILIRNLKRKKTSNSKVEIVYNVWSVMLQIFNLTSYNGNGFIYGMEIYGGNRFIGERGFSTCLKRVPCCALKSNFNFIYAYSKVYFRSFIPFLSTCNDRNKG